jgi:hypothetical protein
MQKVVLLVALIAFTCAELAVVVWAFQVYTVMQLFEEFFDPVSLIILIDFSFFAGAVWIWMLRDGGRGLWKWLPVYILTPTGVLFVYLLLRKKP